MRTGNLLIYSAAEIFCIWQQALPRPRWRRGLRGTSLSDASCSVIVPFALAGDTDARLMGQRLSERRAAGVSI